jgi:rRNA maturation endonuclease Nob1
MKAGGKHNNMNTTTRNFVKLYFEAIDENIDEVVGELRDAGIDPVESQKRILRVIKQERAKIKIEKAKRLKERIQDAIKKKVDSLKISETDKIYALAYRKLGKLNPEDEAMIKKDAALLEEIEKIISESKDET